MERETRITLRLPAKVHEALKEAIKDSRRSLNSEIVFQLENALTKRGERK